MLGGTSDWSSSLLEIKIFEHKVYDISLLDIVETIDISAEFINLLSSLASGVFGYSYLSFLVLFFITSWTLRLTDQSFRIENKSKALIQALFFIKIQVFSEVFQSVCELAQIFEKTCIIRVNKFSFVWRNFAFNCSLRAVFASLWYLGYLP